MVKSTASCFKIITCGSDSVDHDDLQAPEGKGSSGRGWSFRKKSARHRVLSNTVTSEIPSSANKESSESTAVDFQVQPNLNVPEKTSVIQWTTEKTELSAQPELKVSDDVALRDDVAPRDDDCKADATVEEEKIELASLDPEVSEKIAADDCKQDAILDEYSVTVIQAAVRGLLAQNYLLKQKNIVKLQAVVRGHLVRKHAVGTLRCVQAIVKMQALVRARLARGLVEGSGDIEKQNECNEKYSDSTLLSKRQANQDGTYTYISIEKLLSNKFARQLMESTPRTEPINIKCEPLKSDSAWQWLERWMAVSSVSNEAPRESRSDAVQHEKEIVQNSEGEKDISLPSDCNSEVTDLNSGVAATESTEASDNDENYTNDANNLNSHSSKSVAPASTHPELLIIDEPNPTYGTKQSGHIETRETVSILDLEAKTFPNKGEAESDVDIPDSKKRSFEQSETEGIFLARKASNPFFITAQSKFEELSSAGPPAKSAGSSSQEHGVESNLDSVSPPNEQPFKSQTETELDDNPISKVSAVQIGDSECGTELSISSTLDSPARSEIKVNDLDEEPKISDVTDHPKPRENLEYESNGEYTVLGTDLSRTNTHDLERDERVNSALSESLNSVTAPDSPQLENKPEADPSELKLDLESEANHVVDMSSSLASPRSHITVPESQATPSSQVSVKPMKRRGEKTNSNRKNKSSADKKSHSNPNQDFDSRSGSEQKEHKSGKRRSSFGSAKPDHADQEPRDSSSSNSLPSYMQATKSAKAKAIANGSPRSSPDVNDKEIYSTKRHSLPGTNGRQGSPRIQRSLSQAQQNAKANGTHSPQDRKWRR